ncbi:PACE efflux transporter [Rhodobacter sp.]
MESDLRPALSPVRRRILFAVLFESIGLVISTLGLMAFSSSDAGTATGAAIGSMGIALAWNYLFNWGFEGWERRQPVRGRSFRRRLAHGALFEGGLVVLMVPFLAWWMGVGLIEALLYDAGLLVFFAIYTLGFTWAFDRIFGLPASAR